MEKLLIIILSCGIFVYLYLPASADASDSEGLGPAGINLSGIYVKDRVSLQVVSGLLFSPTVPGSQTDVMDLWQTNMRFGWMLTDIYDKKSFLRGNFEAVLCLEVLFTEGAFRCLLFLIARPATGSHSCGNAQFG